MKKKRKLKNRLGKDKHFLRYAPARWSFILALQSFHLANNFLVETQSKSKQKFRSGNDFEGIFLRNRCRNRSQN